VYLSFIALTLFGIVVLGRVVQLQFVQGEKWRNLGDSLYRGIEKRPAERGTIYSEDFEMLSSSIPYFDVHIDFRTDGLRAKGGKLFFANLDSLSQQLHLLFNDKSKAEYSELLKKGYEKKSPYFELKKHLSYKEYFKLRNFSLVKLGTNKSGFVIDVVEERMNPFGLLANRTIGLNRDSNQTVGLEKYYDSILSGQSGSRLVQFIAGGTRVPVSGTEIEPVNGKDIITTINVQIQDIAENALLKMMQQNEALTGTAIVMEVSTGKIKAIANLGKTKKGNYAEINNYALIPSEPGSTIKVVTLMAALEDHIVNIGNTVEINGGIWYYGDRKIMDAEQSPKNILTYKEALEHSSNVAMAKLAALNYAKQPGEYLKHFTRLGLNKKTGIDLNDPYKPLIKNTKSSDWTYQTLASMGFGYELRISPLQTLMIYNAIANNGKMMQPYLVTDIKQGSEIVRHFNPVTLQPEICSNATLLQLKECLEAVCTGGTAKSLFDSVAYTVAGKTGTTQVDDGFFKYEDGAYQSTFVGYFPASHPQYSCIVLIKNKPKAKNYYGAKVAGPVFKEIADQLITLSKGSFVNRQFTLLADSFHAVYKTTTKDAEQIATQLSVPFNSINALWTSIKQNNQGLAFEPEKTDIRLVPDVSGMGLRDALNNLENKGIQVKVKGIGKVKSQSVPAGTLIRKNMLMEISLAEQ
jgi:cell division protein FtsI (penicillin-binding protein 3)